MPFLAGYYADIYLTKLNKIGTKDEIDSVKKRILSENRDGKIESIFNGVEFTEKIIEEDLEYKELTTGYIKPINKVWILVRHLLVLNLLTFCAIYILFNLLK